MRLVVPPENDVSEAVFKKTKEIVHLTAYGTREAADECKLWEVEDPLNNSVKKVMIHYNTGVHGLSIEMDMGPMKSLGSHLGYHQKLLFGVNN